MLGTRLAKMVAAASMCAGYRPEQIKLPTPINIQGVGNGTNQINYRGLFPIAVPTDEGPAQLNTLSAGIVDPPGDELPGLLGMDVLKNKRAILDIGNKNLIFPGPGEVQYVFPPGTVITPLAEAPSGHLCMLIDAYGDIKPGSGGLTAQVPELGTASSSSGVTGIVGDTGAVAPPPKP